MRQCARWLVGFALGAAGSIGAQNAPTNLHRRTPEQFAQEQREKRHIVLNVVVQEKGGRPVGGLMAQDFTVLNNGVRQPVERFTAVDGEMAKKADELVLVFDVVNPSFEDQVLARQGITRYLRQNGGKLALPTTLLYLHDGGIKLTKSTMDGETLATALEGLPGTLQANYSAQGYAGWQERINRSTFALTEIATFEKTQPGRKLVVWTGPAWPLLNFGEEIDRKVRNRFFKTIVDINTTLREANMTVYSVLPLNLQQGPGLRSIQWKSFVRGLKDGSKADTPDLALQVMAYQSGGLVPDEADIAAQIKHCAEDARSYYELSFYAPEATRADEYHELKVMVGRPGVSVRTRTGYYLQP